MLAAIWKGMVLLLFSLILMLAIDQIQLYFLTSIDSYEDIKVGFPYWYYSFSRDGNNFHGGNGSNLIVDYCLTLLTISMLYGIMKLIKTRFTRKKTRNQS